MSSREERGGPHCDNANRVVRCAPSSASPPGVELPSAVAPSSLPLAVGNSQGAMRERAPLRVADALTQQEVGAEACWWAFGSLESAGTRMVLFSLRVAGILRRPVAAAVAGCPAVTVPDPGQLAARVVVR